MSLHTFTLLESWILGGILFWRKLLVLSFDRRRRWDYCCKRYSQVFPTTLSLLQLVFHVCSALKCFLRGSISFSTDVKIQIISTIDMFRGPFYSLFTQAAVSFGPCHNMCRAHVYTDPKPTLQSFENCSCRFVLTFVFVREAQVGYLWSVWTGGWRYNSPMVSLWHVLMHLVLCLVWLNRANPSWRFPSGVARVIWLARKLWQQLC